MTATLESLIVKLNHAAHVILPALYLFNWLCHQMKRREKMGTTTYPTLESPGPPTMDQILPTYHRQRRTNQQHSLLHPNSHTMVGRLWIHNWRLQRQQPSTDMHNPTRMTLKTYTQPIITHNINNINLHYYPTTGESFIYLVIHGQLQCTWLDAQGILWTSKCRISWHRSPLAWLDLHQ